MNARTLGCSVKDDGRPGPCGLDISEHKLSADKTAWLHPVGLDVNGRWTWDEDYCMKRLRCKNTDTLEQRIRAMSSVDENGCWIWQRYCKPNGYAAIGIDYKVHYGHRVSYELFVGPIPDGLQLDHLCRVRNCVNPEHLEPVTAWENTMRSTSPSAVHAAKTHCVNGHELMGENLRIDPRSGDRKCRTCARDRQAEYRARRRSKRDG